MRDTNCPLARVYKTTEELDTPETAQIVGSIPEWLQGSFVRSGPGIFDLSVNGVNFQMKHLIDGYAVLSKFDITENQVIFNKKFVRSDALTRAQAVGRPTVCEFGTRGYTDPGRGLFSRILPNIMPPLTDNCCMAAYALGSKVFASHETCHFRTIDLDSLETTEKFDSMKLFGVNSLTCHPLTDEDGVTYNIGPSLLTGLKYNVIMTPSMTSEKSGSVMETFKNSKIIASVPSSWNGLMSFNHSFAMTKNYIIIIEQPYVHVVSRIVSGVLTKNKSISDWLDWRNDLTNNFLVIEKSTGRLIKTKFCAASPFFFLHVINACEVNGHILIDIFTAPNPSFLSSMTVENLRHGTFQENDLPQAERYVIPLVTNDIDLKSEVNLISDVKTSAKAVKLKSRIVLTPQVLTLPGLDMPTINRTYLGRQYRYFYCTGSVTNGIWRNSIVKVNTSGETRSEVTTWRRSNSYYVGEAIFVPNPDGTSEDDGVLLSAVVTDGSDDADKDFLLILDAKSMEEVARAYVNCHVPQGLHGTFVAKS